MIVETKLELKDFLKVVFLKSARTVIYLLILQLIIVLINWLSPTSSVFDYKDYMPILGLLILFYVLVFFISFRTYKTSYMASEKVIYEFLDENIRTKGESYNSEMTWEKLYLIEEMKEYILIYQGKRQYSIISKSSFGNKLEEFKNLVCSKNIKYKFKK